MSDTKKTTLSSFFSAKCPRCRTGNLFFFPFYHPTKFNKTKERCDFCDIKIEPEPGFFWGAMYFSYAIVVALCIALSVLLYIIFKEPSFVLLVSTILGSIFVLLPLIFRFSRLLMVYLIAPYRNFEPKVLNKTNKVLK